MGAVRQLRDQARRLGLPARLRDALRRPRRRRRDLGLVEQQRVRDRLGRVLGLGQRLRDERRVRAF